MMRLRRLELVVIAVTLAFACFMGGYLTGRSSGTVSISPAVVTGESAPSVIVPQLPMREYASVLPPEQVPPPQSEGAETHVEAEMPVLPAPEPPPPASARDSFGRININIATRTELMDLPGIGPSLSERIVDYRNLHGPFRRIEDIRNVSGIGQQRFDTIRDRITVG